MALTDSILSYWKLDNNGSGGVSLVDSTPNGYTLTNTGSVALGTGKINGCSVFSGTNYLTSGTSFDFSGDLTISLWGKVDPLNGGFLFGDTDGSSTGLSLYLEGLSSGSFVASFGTTFVVTSSNSPTDPTAWNQYVFTREGSTCTLYLNGTSIGTAEDSTDYSAVYGIGYEGYYERYFNGSIDEVGVWNRALSANEVFNLYYRNEGNSYPFTKPVIQPELTDNILAYWKLDNNGSGGVSLVDSTGNNNTLENIDSVALGDGIINGGATYGGTGNYLKTGAGFAPLSDGKSYSGWVYFNNTPTGYQFVFSQGGTTDYQSVIPFYVEGNGTVSSIFTTSNGGWTNTLWTDIVPTEDTWNHFATTFDGSVGKLYWNGVEVASSEYTGSIAAPDNDFFGLGTYPHNTTIGALDGKIDEVGIWSRALSAAEVFNLYYRNEGNSYPFSKPVIEPNLTDNLLAYWKLDNNGSGGVSLVDSTGNGNTLTNNNGVSSVVGIINGGASISNSWLTRSTVINGSPATLAVWFKSTDFSGTSNQGFPIVVDMNGGFQIWASPSQTIQLGIFSNSAYGNVITTPSTYNDGLWHHAVVTRDGNVCKLYVDDVLIGDASYDGINSPWPSGLFCIGAYSDGGFGGTGGLVVDETAVWGRALSAIEISELYNSGVGNSYPFRTQSYFNAAVDGSLSTLGNWWQDSGFTTPADALPDNSSLVFITAPVTSGTATYNNATISANIGSAVSITANTITLNSGINSGTLIGYVVLNNSASNVGTITGETTLNGSSFNNGTITGNATFNANTYNGINGSVSGDATFRGTEGNAGTVGGAANFFDTTENSGTVEGNATFRNSSSNAGGVVEGNATIYNPSANPVAGVVMGTETYLWPNGTGLWGGDVWINGDIAFIIPQPSDVRSGVEYGPASAPYTGTYSGGNKAISISQLLNLPFPINI